MLGLTLKDPYKVENGGEISGLGLLPCETIFAKKKTTVRVEGKLEEVSGIFSGLSNTEFEGYEIHMGNTTNNRNIVNKGNVYGTYIHGIFDKDVVSRIIVEALLSNKGLSIDNVKTFDIKEYKETQYDILAEELRKSLDMDYIYKVIGYRK